MQNNDNDIINSILDEFDSKKKNQEELNTPQAESSVPKINESEPKPEDTEKNAPKREKPDAPMIRRRPEAPKPVSSGTKKKKKKKKKRKGSRLPGVLILTTFIFAVSICLSLVIIAYGKDMLGIGKSENTQLIEIEEGATTEEIANMLEERGIIRSPEFFMLFSRLSGKDNQYIAGEHFIRPNMAYETIITELTSVESAAKESVEVTFPEGITLYDAAVILDEEGICSIDDFLFNFNAGGLGFDFENRITSSSNLKFYRMEGYLFPDTYFFYKDMEPEQVCQKIYLNFNNKLGSSAEFNGKTYENRYQRMEELNLTLDQLITFASIVQKEAATEESMTVVASVFWNRLNHKDEFPLLQSDPTRLYAENVIKPHMAVYDQDMIDAYNTYAGAGLPPGAICNPGIEAIDAVLTNYESTYYFFYANVNTGQTYYANTLEEHENNQEMVKQQIADAEAASEGKDNE
ncbi:MAG: endolytic transglycosylase MltG [Ruminococcus sp.]